MSVWQLGRLAAYSVFETYILGRKRLTVLSELSCDVNRMLGLSIHFFSCDVLLQFSDRLFLIVYFF